METFTEHEIHFMKIALAVAIIRQKPANVPSSREYAKNLQRKFVQEQINWREHAEKLSQELLRVKQKLSLLNQSQSPVEITQPEDMQFSIEDSSSIFSNIELESPSVELQSHIAFLQTASSLLKANTSLSGYSLEAAATLKESIVKAIDILVEYPKTQPLHQSPLTEEVSAKLVQFIAAFMNYEPLMPFRHEIMEAAGKFVKMLTERLCHPSNDTDKISFIQSLLYQLSSVGFIHTQVIQSLTSFIEESTKDLANLKQNHFTAAYQINTLGHVLKVLETILSKYDHPVPPQVMESFEKCVKMTITSKLPLVSITIWRLHQLIMERN
ncbi:PREDICTED: meiosis-specific protein MEI4-like isoform X1 [Amphimedon queenslandica]|uniref:Uncharacterized protein n=2 Tax=Amphimedon queenslandica TaxID=400682 RepID=A0AAN0J9P6_AMPQE|nr:PREDICTED: meiosis-specific protein MEI4-like isoform X1 [Amphimedon queenslandica]|eukprot:XP_019853428.1 PREDICTED: meiosis-specific protein MEI4-like isoform X1 [Amphimedon queenslandica]